MTEPRTPIEALATALDLTDDRTYCHHNAGAILAALPPGTALVTVETLTRALGPAIEPSLTWLQLWRSDKQDEDPWPARAAAIIEALRHD